MNVKLNDKAGTWVSGSLKLFHGPDTNKDPGKFGPAFAGFSTMANSDDRDVLVNSGEFWTIRRFALVLALLICATFPKVLIGTDTFVFRDYALFGYPLAHYHRDCFWRGEIPLWNPFNNSGLPFLAQWNTLVCYPLSLIYLILPLPWSLGMFCLVHLFVGGLGMFFLAQQFTKHPFAAAMAGIGFAFSGVSLSALIWPNVTASLAWSPWVLWLVP